MPNENKTIKQEDLNKIIEWQNSPISFIKDIWGLIPQPIRPEYQNEVSGYLLAGEFSKIKVGHFGKFVKGEHITWQQFLILKSIEKTISSGGKKKISISSGHGIGKTGCLSWVIIWYLCCHYQAQVPCTAPSSQQMHDVLWKELGIWIQRMPEFLKVKLAWSNDYVRVVESPESWFASARTARKENPDALAGFHGENVLLIADEASGVPDQIFRVAEGSLTNENYLFILISNPRRLIGYFYDTHHSDSKSWQLLQFSSEDSPIVKQDFIDSKKKHGIDSDEYRITVKGLFPREDAVDSMGYVPLLKESDLHFTQDDTLVGRKRLGIDPSGEGSDKTEWVARDNMRAVAVASEDVSSPRGIALKSLTLMTNYTILGDDVWIDNFGIGANVSAEIAMAGRVRTNAVNVGQKVNISDTFGNGSVVAIGLESDLEYADLRARAYWTMRKWILSGGLLVGDLDRWKQILTIRYCRDGQGRIKIMSKETMRKNGVDSPDRIDALMLTFIDEAANDVGGNDKTLSNILKNKLRENREINRSNRMS